MFLLEFSLFQRAWVIFFDPDDSRLIDMCLYLSLYFIFLESTVDVWFDQG